MALYGIANRPCMCSSCMMNTRAPDGANKFGWLISNLQVPLEGRHPVLYHNTDLREIYNALQCHAIPSIQHHAIPCNTNAIPSNGWHPSTLLSHFTQKFSDTVNICNVLNFTSTYYNTVLITRGVFLARFWNHWYFSLLSMFFKSHRIQLSDALMPL